MAQKEHSVMVFPFDFCQLRMLGMSGIFLYHFPPCLNPNGPQDVLASALDCPWPQCSVGGLTFLTVRWHLGQTSTASQDALK